MQGWQRNSAVNVNLPQGTVARQFRGPHIPLGVRRLRDVDPIAATVYVLLHLGCVGVFFVAFTAQAVMLLVCSFLARAVAVSVIYHRYFAHRTFQTSRAMQFIFGVYGIFAVMGGPLWWSHTHRQHHHHADTQEDLHSPQYQGFVYSHCGWFLHPSNRSVDYSYVRDLARYPELVVLEKYSFAAKMTSAALFYWAFGLTGVLWGFLVPTIIILQMIHFIQSTSHCFRGYRRFPTPDNSRNHWLFGLVSLGEGFHHNHHAFPSSARLGLAWWEFDVGYWIIRGMQRLGLVWGVRMPRAGATPGAASGELAGAGQ